jgi:hypothetical protein
LLQDIEPITAENFPLSHKMQLYVVPTCIEPAQHKRLQSDSSEALGHALPPNLGSVRVRVRVLRPVPQSLVQVLHVAQAPTTQSSGHACVLQGCVCSRASHPLPPFSSAEYTLRVRLWDPSPQLLLHILSPEDHDDQDVKVQSTGQADELQSSDLVHAKSLQGLPPPQAWYSGERLLFKKPVPQDLLQMPTDAHEPGLQSRGLGTHACAPALPAVQ